MERDESLNQFVADLLRSHSDEIVRSLLAGVFEIDEASSEALFSRMADACLGRFLRMVDFETEMPLDQALERLKRGAHGTLDYSFENETMVWREFHNGECMCPLVKCGIIELDERLCRCCATLWTRGLLAKLGGGAESIEVMESVATGSLSCTFRLKLRSASVPAA